MVNNWLIPLNINENQNFVIANIIQLPNTLVCFGAIQRFKVLSTFAMLTTTNVKSSFHRERFILSSLVMALTRLSRHQVHQAALLPSAGDGPLLPHVLEHIPLGRGLRLHGWVQAVSEAAPSQRAAELMMKGSLKQEYVLNLYCHQRLHITHPNTCYWFYLRYRSAVKS